MLRFENIGLCPNFNIEVICQIADEQKLVLHKSSEFPNGSIYVLSKEKPGYTWLHNVGDLVYSPCLQLDIKESQLKYAFISILDEVKNHLSKLNNVNYLYLSLLGADPPKSPAKFSAVAVTGRSGSSGFGDVAHLWALEDDDVSIVSRTTVRLKDEFISSHGLNNIEMLTYTNDGDFEDYEWKKYDGEAPGLGLIHNSLDKEAYQFPKPYLLALCSVSFAFYGGYPINRNKIHLMYIWNHVLFNPNLHTGLTVWRCDKLTEQS